MHSIACTVSSYFKLMLFLQTHTPCTHTQDAHACARTHTQCLSRHSNRVSIHSINPTHAISCSIFHTNMNQHTHTRCTHTHTQSGSGSFPGTTTEFSCTVSLGQMRDGGLRYRYMLKTPTHNAHTHTHTMHIHTHTHTMHIHTHTMHIHTHNAHTHTAREWQLSRHNNRVFMYSIIRADA
jgi:hypothetical protein